jgi:hypothetical protein
MELSLGVDAFLDRVRYHFMRKNLKITVIITVTTFTKQYHDHEGEPSRKSMYFLMKIHEH